MDDIVDCLNGSAERIADILDAISCDTALEDVVSLEEQIRAYAEMVEARPDRPGPFE